MSFELHRMSFELIESFRNQSKVFLNALTILETVGLKHLREGHTEFDPRCEICVQASLQSKPARRVDRADASGEVSADTVGPLPTTLSNNQYGLVVVIRKSRYSLVEA